MSRPAATVLALRLALREMRGGPRGFYVFLACIALGVAAIAGVASVTRSLSQAIDREGRTILGGDLALSLALRTASDEEHAYLQSLGTVSEAATMRAMARRVDGSDQALIELKAVDDIYPLYGAATLEPPIALTVALAETGGRFGAVADEALLLQLGLAVGEEIRLGSVTLDLRAALITEPDRLSEGIEWGPRLLISQAALAATGLIQPGSLVEWLYRVRLDEPPGSAQLEAMADRALAAFPTAGWRIRTSDNAAPGLERNLERLGQFLTLVGLSALLVGGVGIANAVGAYLAGKRTVIATLKCLGAPGGLIVGIYLAQTLILAVIGILIGLLIGLALPFVAAWALSGVLPIPVAPSIYPAELALAAAYGLATSLAFSLWPLGTARDVPPAALFRDRIAVAPRRPRFRYLAAALTAGAILVALAVGLARDRAIALTFVLAALAALIILRVVARLIMSLARRLPPVPNTELRLAIANLHRPGALTPTVVLSLGLGLTLLTALALVDGNIRRDMAGATAEGAPSFLFLDVPSAQADAFASVLREAAPGSTLTDLPMLRGRVTAVDGVPAAEIEPKPEIAWVLRGDRGLTYASAPPANASLLGGEWWPADYAGPPLLSLDLEVAEGFGLTIGDTLTFNVLGREITATVVNLREIEWQSFAINFFFVLSPEPLRAAPHVDVVSLTMAGSPTTADELALLNKVGAAYPAVTGMRVKEAVERVNDLIRQISWAVLGASSVTILTAILVLAGALAAGHHRRLYDAVILKTLGATRRSLLASFTAEYLLLGLTTALFGLGAGGLVAWYVVVNIMETDFSFLAPVALAATAAAVFLTLVLGLAGTWRVLGQKAAPVLRSN